jgi:predicted RNA methylase
LQFLRTATRLATRAVYSFHKRSTRQFLLNTIQNDWGYNDAKVVAEMAFDVQNMYKFHTQKSKDIEVDLIRIAIENGEDA